MKQKTTWKQQKITLGNAIIIAAVLAVLGGVVGFFSKDLFNGFAPYLGLQKSSTLDWSALNEVYSQLKSTYDGQIDNATVIEGAKKGLVASLGDVYTVYMDEQETIDFNDSLHGNVGSGVGIEMGLRDGYVRVLRTLPDNPARAAGVLAGDIIYKVDGEEVYSLDVDKIAQKVRGETGSEVTLTVVRDGQELSFTMIRETINNVSAFLDYKDNTAIISVTRFDVDTGSKVRKFAQEAVDKGVKKVILDLRDNGGGYVSAAQEMLSLWVDPGKAAIVQKSLHYGDETMAVSSGSPILSNMKTIILINGSTASASEIVAGALQDYGKATILGEKSYGKGVMQGVYNLSGNTTLKVTIASWYTPNGRSINKEGIVPDVEVKRTYDDINQMRDPQLDKALGL